MANLPEYVAPVPPGGPGGHHVAGEAKDAAAIVADITLLREVLRRAALICPDELEDAAKEGRERIAAVRQGDYQKRFGKS